MAGGPTSSKPANEGGVGGPGDKSNAGDAGGAGTSVAGGSKQDGTSMQNPCVADGSGTAQGVSAGSTNAGSSTGSTTDTAVATVASTLVVERGIQLYTHAGSVTRSRDPNKLLLPAYFLPAGYWYVIKATAKRTDPSTGGIVNSSTLLNVTMTHTAVVASVKVLTLLDEEYLSDIVSVGPGTVSPIGE